MISLKTELEEAKKIAIQAESIFAHELHRLSQVVEYENQKDDEALRSALREIELSSIFAKAHLEYLVSVIKKEQHRLDILSKEIAEARARRKFTLADRLSQRFSVQKEKSQEHLTQVLKEVTKNLERDAEISAKNIARYLGSISANEREFHNLFDMISEKSRTVIRSTLEG